MVLLISGGHYRCTKTVHQYGLSIQSSTMVCETFRQITQKLWATETWDLHKLFRYQSFMTFHFLGFIHWTVFHLFFLCCVYCMTVKMIYWTVSWKMIPYSRPKLSDLYILCQSKLLENHTLHSSAYLYSPYMAVPPSCPPPPEQGLNS